MKNRKKTAKIWSKLAIFYSKIGKRQNLRADTVLCGRQPSLLLTYGKKQQFRTDLYFEIGLNCFLAPKNGRTSPSPKTRIVNCQISEKNIERILRYSLTDGRTENSDSIGLQRLCQETKNIHMSITRLSRRLVIST